MDIISHALIGKIFSGFKKNPFLSHLWIIFFSFAADLTQIPFFIYLGYLNSRPFFYPALSDWNGARALHPFLNTIYEIPHSFFFAFLIILPLILIFKLPKLAFFSYLFHLIADLPTHTKGEWAMKPFYPFQWEFGGFTNAWAWPILAMALSWIILAIIIFMQKQFSKNAVSRLQN